MSSRKAVLKRTAPLRSQVFDGSVSPEDFLSVIRCFPKKNGVLFVRIAGICRDISTTGPECCFYEGGTRQ